MRTKKITSEMCLLENVSIMRKRIEASHGYWEKIRAEQEIAGRKANGIIRAKLNFTTKSPQMFTSIGSLFANADCQITLGENSSSMSLVEDFSIGQYKRVVIPLCAALNRSVRDMARFELTQIK